MDASFTTRVAAQVERLSALPLQMIETQVAAKRRLWFEQHPRPIGERSRRPTPRTAFETLFFDYMGLTSEDLPVIRESDDEIVWQSRNPCPTLDACVQLGLDTRVVCRGAYEKSTQAFISLVDPQLRFVRDYRVIRPHERYCQESIVRVDFEQMMRIAIEEAEQSRHEGNKGYGAVIAHGGHVLARTHDTAIADRDPSRHAEVNAIRDAVHALADSDLSGAVLFSTCEPCPMCSSLAVWANVSAVVFGASIAATAARGKARIAVPAAEIVARSPVSMEIYPGVLEPECLALY